MVKNQWQAPGQFVNPGARDSRSGGCAYIHARRRPLMRSKTTRRPSLHGLVHGSNSAQKWRENASRIPARCRQKLHGCTCDGTLLLFCRHRFPVVTIDCLSRVSQSMQLIVEPGAESNLRELRRRRNFMVQMAHSKSCIV